MKIGLLLCDHIQKEFPDYPELFMALLPNYDYELFDVCNGTFPHSANICDAWLITGSKYSVYDELDWIIWLKGFVREIESADKHCIGVCFGHQMLGEAMGGKVKKSENGWCVGVHQFEAIKNENWMVPFQHDVNLLMSCQDQIQVLPPNSTVIAKATNCPVGIIRIGKRMLGIQGHPEFSADYVKFLMMDRTNRIGERVVKKGVESLSIPLQNSIVAHWIEHFLED